MDYYKYEFQTGKADNEVLMAMMSLLPFETFVEEETGFCGYIPATLYNPEIEKTIKSYQADFDFQFDKEFIKGENWNEAWESNFHPIIVDDFCGIRAGFHSPLEGVQHELIITPKMAFGTGHHETTFMVIQLMEQLDFSGKMVLDYGCGTGVLSILASGLGAAKIDAIDIEEAAWQNTIENCETNGIDNVNALMGDLDVVSGKRYGIVLANINRNVILSSLESLSQKLNPGGYILFSGILKTDQQLMQEAFREHRINCDKVLEKNKWLAMQCHVD